MSVNPLVNCDELAQTLKKSKHQRT